MPRKGFTFQQSRLLEQVVGRAYELQYDWKEASPYIMVEMKLDKPITKQAYNKILNRIHTKAGLWSSQLKTSPTAYHMLIRRRYEAMLYNEWRLQRIAEKAEAEGKADIAISATRESQAVTRQLSTMTEAFPYLLGGKFTIDEEYARSRLFTNNSNTQERSLEENTSK